MRVLLTGAGGPAARSLARQLRARGEWTGGVDVRALDVPELDAFRQVAPATDPAYLRDLAALVAHWQIDAVIPSLSEELLTLAHRRDRFPAPIVIAEAEPVAIAADKLLTARALESCGVAVPAFSWPGVHASAAAAIAAHGGAIVVKPRVSRGGRGVRLVTAVDAGSAATEKWWASLDGSWIVQSFAPGVEYAPVVHRSLGGASLCVVLEKTELKDGLVGNAVSTARVERPEGYDVHSLAVRAVHALGLTGPVDLDIRRRGDGLPVVLEVNARFGANSAQAPELLERVLAALQANATPVIGGRRARQGVATAPTPVGVP